MSGPDIGRSATNRLLSRIASFSGLSVLGAIAPLIVLPAVARVGGIEGWAAVTVAQAVGSMAGVLVGQGYGTIGPARLSGKSPSVAARIFSSVQTRRLAVYLAIGPLAALLSALLAADDSYRLLAVLVTLASATSGLSLSWFAIGRGQAPILAIYDAIPKLISNLLALGVVTVTQNLIYYPILLWVFTLGGIAAFWCKNGSRDDASEGHGLKPDWNAAGCELAAACYVSAPLIVAGVALSAVDTSQLGSIDKLYRYALYGVFAFSSSTLAWILEDHRGTRARRTVSLILVLIGVAGGALLMFAGHQLTSVLFGAAVAAPTEVCVGYALAYFCVASSTPFIQYHLIPSGMSRSVLLITAATAAVGLPTMVLLGKALGVAGVSAGFGLSEFLGLCVAVAVTFKLRRVRARVSTN